MKKTKKEGPVGFDWAVRKTTKTKGAFASGAALPKLLYLTLDRKKDVGSKKTHGFKAVQRSLEREFGERFSWHVTN
jgi:transposase-like protein